MDAIQFFSHTTAALLWGLPLNARHEEMHGSMSPSSPRGEHPRVGA